MPFGLLVSFACHAALLVWAYVSMRAVHELPTPDTPAISAELITPSEFLRLKQGSEDAKQLESKAKDKPTQDDSKEDTKKPDNAPPPPPPPAQEVAKVEPPAAEPPPPPTPEPPKAEPPPPDPIAEQLKEPPPPTPPEPEPGPTPDEQKLLEQKLADEQKQAEEAKKKAEEEAKKKAAAEALKKKLAEEAKKKKLAEEARKKAEAAKKKFDPNALASLIEKTPGETQPKALVDKDPTKKGQQAVGTSRTATAYGKEAGTATGTDTVLSAREQDLLKGLIKSQLQGCWRLPGAGGGTDTPVVTLKWHMKPDGNLDGDPMVQSAPPDQAGQVAAEAALRAVKGCQPFRLPPDKYDGWRDVIWVFDPRQML